jgi:hypothetical protein
VKDRTGRQGDAEGGLQEALRGISQYLVPHQNLWRDWWEEELGLPVRLMNISHSPACAGPVWLEDAWGEDWEEVAVGLVSRVFLGMASLLW